MKKRRRVHLFVLIDALGWQALDGIEFLLDMLPHRRPLRTVLGFSSAAIPTLLTGRPPSETGHWNLFYYDPEGSPFRWLRYISFLPDFLINSRVARKILKELGRRALGMGKNFECCVNPRLMPYFNWLEKRNIFDRCGISEAPSIFDDFAERGIPYRVYTYHDASDSEIVGQAMKDLSSNEADFYFVYLCELDMFLHMNCGDSDGLRSRLKWYEAALRRLMNAASEVADEVVFTVCSDHGMAPVRDHFDLVEVIGKLNLKMPADYLAVYDSTMARFWFFNEESRRKVVTTLNEISNGRILPEDELRRLGIWFPDQRYGQLVFLLNPGVMLTRSDFNGRSWTPLGMHGYDPEDPWSDAILLSNRPFAPNLRTLADAHHLLRDALEEVTSTGARP
jgi:hypothetical protein